MNPMASSSTSSYQDNLGIVNGFANIPGLLPQTPWQAMMPQNTLSTTQQQQQPPQLSNFSYPHMQNQPMQTGVPGMYPGMQPDPTVAAFSNSLAQAMLPAQFLQDAVRLSAPVGSSVNDDELLAKALHDTKKNGLTYRRAIEGLHGVNNHAANLWKDYYLDHKPRIDRLVASLGDVAPEPPKPPVRPPYTTIKPGGDVKKFDSPPTSSSHTKRRNSLPKPKPPPKALTRRKTFNSITAPSPTYDSSMPAPNAEVQVPDPPSRSPTPPSRIVPGANGNRYTDEDKEYFVKFITWRLKLDPTLTKQELCELLAQKAPHHTQMSWASHWHYRHDIADKILAAAQPETDESGSNDPDDADVSVNGDEDRELSTKRSRESKPRKRHRRHVGVSESSSDSESSSSSYRASDDDGLDVVNTGDDEERMTQSGSIINRADIRVMARYVASTKNWDDLGTRERWNSFSDRFPQRSYKSWAEGYRKHKKAVHRFARRFQKQKRNQSPGHHYGRPRKRKNSLNGDGVPRRNKRVKGDEEDYSVEHSEADDF